jgi:hypothetical protein
MREILVIAGGILFLSGTGAYIYAKAVLQPRSSDEHLYYQFEERDPGLTRYNRLSRLAIACAAVGALLLFLSTT